MTRAKAGQDEGKDVGKDPAASPEKRTRKTRPYPSASFEETVVLGAAIHEHASGGPVRRLTLLEKMGKSPTSSATRDLITNSGKYGVTSGSYTAESLALTPVGSLASDPTKSPAEQLAVRFELAINSVAPFKILYDSFVGKRLPSHEVMRDVLATEAPAVGDARECVDLFVVNAKFLGLLRPIGGVETLVAPDDVEAPTAPATPAPGQPPAVAARREPPASDTSGIEWSKICFFIAPIGSEGSEERKHSDLVLRQLVEPALAGQLKVIRADEIEAGGMITTQVIEYVAKARLVVADLSFHNPNVFYELALRHGCRKPVIHLIRKCDKIPFDISQSRMIQIDTTDIYSLVPQMETYRSQITTFAKSALTADEPSGPLETYYPNYWNEIARHPQA
jgi:hypothetical protein